MSTAPYENSAFTKRELNLLLSSENSLHALFSAFLCIKSSNLQILTSVAKEKRRFQLLSFTMRDLIMMIQNLLEEKI